MNTILHLTINGAGATLVVYVADGLFRKSTSTQWRRLWWLLVPVAFVVTIPLPVIPAAEKSQIETGPFTIVKGSDSAHADLRSPSGTLGNHLRTPDLGSRALLAEVLVWIWATGVGLGLILTLVRIIQTYRFWSHQKICADLQLLDLLENCKCELDVRTSILLIVSEHVAAPAILGGFPSRLLLPQRLATGLTRAELRSIFLHELAHFRAGDLVWNWMFIFVTRLHWFNPLAHLALRSWRHFIEESADERALSLIPLGETAYGEVLLKSIQHTHSCPPYGALAISESLTQLKQRVAMIKNHNKRTNLRRPILVSFVSFLLLFSIIFPLSRAEEPALSNIVTRYSLDPIQTIYTEPFLLNGKVIGIRFRAKDVQIEGDANILVVPKGGIFHLKMKIMQNSPLTEGAINQIIVGLAGETKGQVCVWNGKQRSGGEVLTVNPGTGLACACEDNPGDAQWVSVSFDLTIPDQPGVYYIRTRATQEYQGNLKTDEGLKIHQPVYQKTLEAWGVNGFPGKDSNIGVIVVDPQS